MLIALAQNLKITPGTVIAILAASTIVVVAIIVLIAYFAYKTPADENGGPLHYGNFFVVSLGILAALIGFLVAFPLVVSDVFEDPTQVIALLSGLFGTIVGLVGTYFGVKSSGDASQRTQELAKLVTKPREGPSDGADGEASKGTGNRADRAADSDDTGNRGGPAPSDEPPRENET